MIEALRESRVVQSARWTNRASCWIVEFVVCRTSNIEIYFARVSYPKGLFGFNTARAREIKFTLIREWWNPLPAISVPLATAFSSASPSIRRRERKNRRTNEGDEARRPPFRSRWRRHSRTTVEIIYDDDEDNLQGVPPRSGHKKSKYLSL